jgi:tRNA A37 threonylcarbamoyladenosine dehydratase
MVLSKYIAIFVGGLCTGYLTVKLCNLFRRRWLKRYTPEDFEETLDQSEETGLIREQLKRNYEFFGEDGMKSISNSFVVVVGIGGVGSHVIMTLIRSGVSKLRVIDYDIVTLSSLNRHAFAFRRDVGKLKVNVVKEYAARINPNVVIETVDDAFLLPYAERYILKGNPDYIVDCIDDLEAKCDLLKFCEDNKLRVISSMGAGGRLDPTSIRLATMEYIKGENMARRLRHMYKKKFNKLISSDVKCIYSVEKPFRALSDLEPHQKDNPEDYRINFNERVRSLPVFASLPAIFGQSLASIVLCDLAKVEVNNLNKSEDKDIMVGNIALIKLIEDFKKQYKDETIELSLEDFHKVVHAFKYVSAVSQKTGNKTKLAVWDHSKPISVNNLVLLNRSEQNKHNEFKSVKDMLDFYGEENFNRIVMTLESIHIEK